MIRKRLIAQGRTAEVYEWEENKVLKLFRANIPEIAIQNEYKVSMELHRNNMPVAGVYDLIEVDNRIGILYERIEGPTMMNVLSTQPWRIPKEAQRLAEIHVALQKNFEFELPNQKYRLKDDIARVPVLTEDIKEYLYEYIEKLPDGPMLCHGDFHPDNVIISNGKIIVIDWMTATKGNPLCDVARTSVLFKYAVVPNHKSFLQKTIVNVIRKTFYNNYIKTYIKLTGTSIEEIEKWELPIVAARLNESIPENEKQLLKDIINESVLI